MTDLSEEDLKVKVILPWLTGLGFGIADMSFEHTFDLHVGENAIRIGGGQATKPKIHARTDILVRTPAGKNLFIVELKKPTERLGAGSRSQALSYARLLKDGIAPFCIVTNGRETECYDSVTGDIVEDPAALISHPYVKSGGRISGDCIAQRYEAVLLLLSLSSDNLQRLCEVQVQRRMRMLRGDDPFCGKKYIPSLHVPRSLVEERIFDLLDNEKRPVVLLIGDPQVGKTNTLCHIAERCLAESRPCLFYPAIGLRSGLIEELAEDFSWRSEHGDTSRGIVNKVFGALASVRNKLLIIIDGWNEASDELARKIDHDSSLLGSESVQLLVSFTSSSSRRLLCDSLGNPAFISESSFPIGDAYRILEIGSSEIPANWSAVSVSKYNEDEQKRAYGVYAEIFNVQIPKEHEYVRDPLLLRLAAEASACGTFPPRLDEPALLRRSVEVKCGRARGLSADVAKVYAQVLAETICRRGAPVELRVFIAAIAKSPVDELAQGLFESALFARAQDFSAIDFYSHRERNYVIAYLVKRWNADSSLALQSVRDNSLKIEPVADAYTWFLSQPVNLDSLIHVSSSLITDDASWAWHAVIAAVLQIGSRENRDLGDKIVDIATSLLARGLKTSDPSIRFHAVKILPLAAVFEDELDDVEDELDGHAVKACLDRDLLLSVLELDEEFPFTSSTYGQIVLSTLEALHLRLSEDGEDSELTMVLTALGSHASIAVRAATFRCLGFISPWALAAALIPLRLDCTVRRDDCPDYVVDAMVLTCSRLSGFLYGDICRGMLDRLECDPDEASYYYEKVEILEEICSVVQDARLDGLRKVLAVMKDLAVEDQADEQSCVEALETAQNGDAKQLGLFVKTDDKAE